MLELIVMTFFAALAGWILHSRSSDGTPPQTELSAAEVLEISETREFRGHTFMRLRIKRFTGRRVDPVEVVEAQGLVPRLWAPHIRTGVRILVEHTAPSVDRVIPTDYVWDPEQLASDLAAAFEDPELQITDVAVVVTGLRSGVEASVEVDEEGFLLLDVATPLRPDDEDLTVDYERFDEDLEPAGQLVAPGIAADAWIAGGEDRRVPDEFRRAAVDNQDAMRTWLAHFEEISCFAGHAETYTRVIAPEPQISIDLLDAFIELTRGFAPEHADGEFEDS